MYRSNSAKGQISMNKIEKYKNFGTSLDSYSQKNRELNKSIN